MADPQPTSPAEDLEAMAGQLHADNVDRFNAMVADAEAWLASRPVLTRGDPHDDYWAEMPEMVAAFRTVERWLGLENTRSVVDLT